MGVAASIRVMPCTVTREPRWLVIEFRGIVSKVEFLKGVETVEAFEQDPACPVDRIYLLAGIFGRDLDFSTLERHAAPRLSGDFDRPARSALVAATPAGTNYANLFQKLNINPQLTHAQFRTREDAEAWLSA